MAKSQSTKVSGIKVPSLKSEDTNIQEDNKTMDANMVADAQEQEQWEEEEAADLKELQDAEDKAQEDKDKQEQEDKSKQEDKDKDDLVSGDDVLAYTPDAIEARLTELEENNRVFTRMSAKMPASTHADLRESLGITEDLEADKARVREELGGKVASLIDALKEDNIDAWIKVREYKDLLDLTEYVNELRASLGLALLSIAIGGKTKGASATLKATIHPRRMSGFLKIGTVNGRYSGCDVKFVSTEDSITLYVNNVKHGTFKQGETSISKIVNDYMLPACGASPKARKSAVEWFADNGYTPDEWLLNVKPTNANIQHP